MRCIVAAVRRVCDNPSGYNGLAESVLQSCTSFSDVLGPKYQVCFYPGRTMLDTSQRVYPGDGAYSLSTRVSEEEILGEDTQCLVNSEYVEHLRSHLVALKSGHCVKMPPSLLCRGPGKRSLPRKRE
jgi:hypothetical protein